MDILNAFRLKICRMKLRGGGGKTFRLIIKGEIVTLLRMHIPAAT